MAAEQKEKPTFPLDILSRITQRLHFKSILRFSSIPEFRQALNLQKPYNFPDLMIFALHGLFIYVLDLNSLDDRNPTKIPLPNELIINNNYDEIELVGSSNGIICIRYKDNEVITLLNPITGTHKTLPPSPWEGSNPAPP